jgi:hypothetical protein
MDRIIIRELLVRCVLGVDDEERRGMQDVLVTVTLHADLRRAGESDRLVDAIDYRAIKKQPRSMPLGRTRCFLFEWHVVGGASWPPSHRVSSVRTTRRPSRAAASAAVQPPRPPADDRDIRSDRLQPCTPKAATARITSPGGRWHGNRTPHEVRVARARTSAQGRQR